jgi:hypothetical protein
MRHVSPSLSLPDANDRHVLAAEIEAHATVIVTFNLSDFPTATLEAYGIEPLHPDIFLSALFDDDPELFLRAVQDHRASLHHPPKTAADYVQTLRATGLRRLALRVEAHLTEILLVDEVSCVQLPWPRLLPQNPLPSSGARCLESGLGMPEL